MRKFFYKLLIFTLVTTLTISYADTVIDKPKSLLQKLMDTYASSAATNSILKHLLDAKMYLSTAEHDLLVSHDKEGAQSDIENSIVYLVEAEKKAQPDTIENIVSLISDLKKLESKTKNNKNSGVDTDTNILLATANQNLIEAKMTATPATKKKIDEIILSVRTLKKQIEYTSLRDDYETAMTSLNAIIGGLK